MKIEFLYFDGCPNYGEAHEVLKNLLRKEGVSDPIEVIHIKDEGQAREHGFLGSPSIRIDGKDIEEDRRGDSALYGCRLYPSNSENQGLPPESMIVGAIRKALGKNVSAAATAPAKARGLKGILMGSGLAALVGSACCWGPALFIFLGIGAAGVGGFIESLRPYLGVVSVGLLGYALFIVYRKKTVDACCNVPEQKRGLAKTRLAVWLVAVLALGAFAYPQWGGSSFGVDAALAGDAEFRISGMTCQACADRVCSVIKQIPGVKTAEVDLNKGVAKVVWNEVAVTTEVISSVEKAGFTADVILVGPKKGNL